MLAVSGDLPANDEDWAFEFKWDGIRAVAVVDDESVGFWSRNQKDMTSAYPELAGLADQLGSGTTVLDGEIVVLDENHRPDFGLLAHRMHIRDKPTAARLAESHPATYFVFDVLRVGDVDATALPWVERRSVLESLELEGATWRVPPAFVSEGRATLDAARQLELEGVVAKRLESTYRPGMRSDSWRKVKLVRHDEFVIGGWTAGQGARSTGFGALLLGVNDGSDLRYVGSVGTGFTDAAMGQILADLEPLTTAEDPFAIGPSRPVATFARPELVAEIKYGEWTRDLVLRHPSFMGMRFDRHPNEVELASLQGLGRRLKRQD